MIPGVAQPKSERMNWKMVVAGFVQGFKPTSPDPQHMNQYPIKSVKSGLGEGAVALRYGETDVAFRWQDTSGHRIFEVIKTPPEGSIGNALMREVKKNLETWGYVNQDVSYKIAHRIILPGGDEEIRSFEFYGKARHTK